MKFSSDLASIHGYLCSDGYVIRNPSTQKHKYYMIGLRNTNQILLDDFQAKFHRVFGIKPIITNEGRCRIQSKEVYHLITKNQSFYSHHWTLPKMNKECLSSWLRSYFDCDGWVTAKARQNRHIGLDSVNHKGIMQIKEALKMFGISCIIKPHRNLFRLQIFGKENITKFKRQIGFLHPKKVERLEKAIASYVEYDWKFPKDPKELKRFIIILLKSKHPEPNRLRINSIKIKNLVALKKHLKELLDIESKIYGPKTNAHGSVYYVLSIQHRKYLDKIEKL